MPTRIYGRVAALAAAITIAAMCVPASGHAQQQQMTTTYSDFDELTDEMEAIADRSDAVEMRSIGRSHEGRQIWLLEIGDDDGGGAPLDERPALLIAANLEANHLVGSRLALDIANHFATNDDDPDVRRVLDEQVVYVLPRLNPDGAEAMFASVVYDRTRNARPYDDDNDGRIDEDGPDDLNGDGMITVMRVPDPSGAYTIDPDDPRLMKRADPAAGERGEYTLYWEGTDRDGDGFINEDGPGGVDLNRNFQHAYPYWERDAGPHMVSEPEARALVDFMIAHRNIAAVLAFGTTDNLVSPPDTGGELADAIVPALAGFADASNGDVWDVGVFGGVESFEESTPDLRGAQLGRDNDPESGRRPAMTVDGADVEYYATVSEAYGELTGIGRAPIHRDPEGAFFQYGYFHFGVPSFTTLGWGVPEDGVEGEGDAAILSGLEATGTDPFVAWSAYEHPELGTVEIGGFRPGATVNPTAGALSGLGDAHGRFAVRLAGMLPRVRIVETDVTAHGGGVYTVEATIENGGYFPTALRHGVVADAVDPVTVQIGIPSENLVSGDAKTGRIDRLEGSGTREHFLWVVRGQPGQSVEIRSRAQKGGGDVVTVELR